MSYIPTELNDSLHWDLMIRREYESRVEPYYRRFKTVAISPIMLEAGSSVLLLGCRSLSAKPTWFFGCWAEMRLKISPSSTSEFFPEAVSSRQACRLERLTLLQFPLLNPLPYLLVVTPAPWLRDFYLEIWRYSGPIAEGQEFVPEMLASLRRIEQKIDQ